MAVAVRGAPICLDCHAALTAACRDEQEREYLGCWLSTRAEDHDPLTRRLRTLAKRLHVNVERGPRGEPPYPPATWEQRSARHFAPWRPEPKPRGGRAKKPTAA